MDLNDEFQLIFQRANLELHPDSPVPIYYQLSRLLLKLIQDEMFQPGNRFPSEEAIASYYQVSRPTANKAVQLLLNEGWLARDKQDKRSGTSVKEKPYISLGFLTGGMSFADQFPPDVPVRSEIIWIKSVPATFKVAKILHLQEKDPVIHIRRLRYAFDQPIMVCDSQFSKAKFPGLTGDNLVQDSLYKTMEERFNCPIVSSERQATAVEAVDPEVVTLLGVPPFSSLLLITGVSFNINNEPIDFLHTYLQPGVSLRNRIQRSAS